MSSPASEISSAVYLFLGHLNAKPRSFFWLSFSVDSMRVLSCLVLSIILLSNSYFAEFVKRQVLAEESSNGDVYLPAGVAAFSSYTISTRSSVQPTPGCNSSLTMSRNTNGGLTSQISQTLQSSLRRHLAAEPTGLADVDTHTSLTSTRPSTRITSNRSSTSSRISRWGITSSHTSQGSQSTISQNSSALRNEEILADTTSTFTSIPLATPSTGKEPLLATPGLISSRQSVLTQISLSMPSNSKSPSARVSTYPAVASGSGSSTTKLSSSSEWSPISNNSHSLPAVTSVPGPNGNITTSEREPKSSQSPSLAGASANTATFAENKDPLATSTSTKATTTPLVTLSSALTVTKTSVGNWPATISFCSVSDGVAIVGVGYVTTLPDGKSSITNTIPSQSLISASAGSVCAGEVAVSSDRLTATIQLSTLPSATPFPQYGAQLGTQSGTVVKYTPETLIGYNNAQPIEISTNFVEVINGHTTTQGGWWLIGAYGHIEVPKDRPWNTGKGVGCIGGPALCNMPCGVVDVGLDLFVLIDHDGCTPDETGPPGYPGGAVISIDPIPDPPYPQEEEGSDDGQNREDPNKQTEDVDKKTATKEEESTTTSEFSTLTSRPRSITSSFTVSSASQISSSSAAAVEYMIIAAVGADQTSIQQTLQNFDPGKGGSYKPDVGNTSVSGGSWVYYDLTPYEAGQLSSRSDILAVVTCATVDMFGPGSSPSAPPQTVDSTVSLVTLDPPSSATLPASIIPKRRRGDVGPRSSSGVLRDHVQTRTKVETGLQKRDPGTRLVRQKRTLNTYPENLSVLAWAPKVPSVAGVDYIFEETKGENTWVYLIDTGVAYRHWVCVKESDHGYRAILRYLN